MFLRLISEGEVVDNVMPVLGDAVMRQSSTQVIEPNVQGRDNNQDAETFFG
jgi:hypothetical protein